MEGSLSDPRLQALLDKQEITELLHRYSRGSDRGDADLLRSVYLPEAWEDHGDTYRGPASGFIDMVVGFSAARFASTSHLIHNILIELDGDTARSECHVEARHVCGHDDAPVLMTFAGRYLDRLVRTPDGWRIAHRVVVCEWQGEQSLYSTERQGLGYLRGTRDRSDLSYADRLPRRAATPARP